MQRTLVISSNLVSVGYDQLTYILEIEFHHGDIYQYSSVPQYVYSELMIANSKGTYFNDRIKDHFNSRKVN